MHFVFQRKPYHRQSAQLCDKNLVNQCQYLLGQHAQQTPRYNSPHDTAQGLCMSKAPSTRVGTVCAWRVTLRPQRAVCDAFAGRTTERQLGPAGTIAPIAKTEAPVSDAAPGVQRPTRGDDAIVAPPCQRWVVNKGCYRCSLSAAGHTPAETVLIASPEGSSSTTLVGTRRSWQSPTPSFPLRPHPHANSCRLESSASVWFSPHTTVRTGDRNPHTVAGGPCHNSLCGPHGESEHISRLARLPPSRLHKGASCTWQRVSVGVNP